MVRPHKDSWRSATMFTMTACRYCRENIVSGSGLFTIRPYARDPQYEAKMRRIVYTHLREHHPEKLYIHFPH